VRLGYEAWRRIPGLSVFGAIGDVGPDAQSTRPYSRDFEQRSISARPDIMALVGGPRALLLSPAFPLSRLRIVSGLETANQEYRTITPQPAGEYIDRDGVLGSPPDLFNPDELRRRHRSAGR
jgi:hypothetical protein